MFERAAVRKDTTREYSVEEDEDLLAQLANGVQEDDPEGQVKGSKKERRQRTKPNMEDVEPRRSSRLARKKVTMAKVGTVDYPETLPYYVAAVEDGYAGQHALLQPVTEHGEAEEEEEVGDIQEEAVEETMAEDMEEDMKEL